MKKNSFVVIIFCILLMSACQPETKEDAATDVAEIVEVVDKPDNSILGTWEMVSYKYGTDTFLSDVPEFIKYRKHITDSHFSWVSFGEGGDNIHGTGGGTYKLKDGKYVEKIEFFMPPGSNLTGTSVAFDYSLDNDQWSISGYVKEVNLNPTTGEFAAVDSTWLEEVWKRVE